MRPHPAAPAQTAARANGNRRRSLAFLLLVGGAYIAALLYVDRGTGILARLAELTGPLAVCCGLVLLSFSLRYQRWRAALAAQGHDSLPWWTGFRGYLAGFAFTASPGKAGELLRIRYFGQMGVPSAVVLGTFIYERALDLVVITALGIGAATLIPAFGSLVVLVGAFLLVLVLASCWPWMQDMLLAVAARLPWQPLRRFAGFLVQGVQHTGPLLRLSTLVPGTLLGTAAWCLTAAAFAYLCSALGLAPAWYFALGIYPLAMLAGAISFVPGGVGTTEAAIVLMLKAVGADLGTALAAAIGIRLVSLWMAVAVGMLAMFSLELRPPKDTSA